MQYLFKTFEHIRSVRNFGNKLVYNGIEQLMNRDAVQKNSRCNHNKVLTTDIAVVNDNYGRKSSKRPNHRQQCVVNKGQPLDAYQTINKGDKIKRKTKGKSQAKKLQIINHRKTTCRKLI